MSQNTQTSTDLETKIAEAKKILSEENVPLTKLADVVEELTKTLNEQYPEMMKLAMSVGAAAPATGNNDSDTSNNAPTSFDILITDIGPEKLKLIKEVRGISGLGLAESKALIDKVASEGKSVLQSGVDTKTAEEIKGKIEAIGAKVSLVGTA